MIDLTAETSATLRAPSAEVDDGDDQFLLILFGASSRTHKLPAEGDVVIGRSQSATVPIDDQEISRHHARLSVRQGEVSVADLESQNGTLVNGEPLIGTRLLLTGDLITVGRATLVFHAGRRAHATLEPLDFRSFRERLADELERAQRYPRGFAVACVDLVKRLDERRVGAALGRLLRRLDAATWAGDTQLFVLLPETDAVAARDAGHRFVTGLEEVGAEPRVGYALFPGDASGDDALVAAARAGRLGAPPTGWPRARERAQALVDGNSQSRDRGWPGLS